TGGTFDVSMLESNVAQLTPRLIDHQLGRRPTCAGHTMYRCAGDDGWIAVSAPPSEEHAALPQGLTSAAAATALQAAGLPAAPALGAEDLLFDDHVRARDVVVELPHGLLGIVPVHGVPFRSGPGFMEARGPAPDLGQHTCDILKELG